MFLSGQFCAQFVAGTSRRIDGHAARGSNASIYIDLPMAACSIGERVRAETRAMIPCHAGLCSFGFDPVFSRPSNESSAESLESGQSAPLQRSSCAYVRLHPNYPSARTETRPASPQCRRTKLATDVRRHTFLRRRDDACWSSQWRSECIDMFRCQTNATGRRTRLVQIGSVERDPGVLRDSVQRRCARWGSSCNERPEKIQ